MAETFEVIGPLRDVETIASGPSVHSREYRKTEYGAGRWRKVKGVALIRYIGGRMCDAELHWYEAHGRGRKEFKVKRELT